MISRLPRASPSREGSGGMSHENEAKPLENLPAAIHDQQNRKVFFDDRSMWSARFSPTMRSRRSLSNLVKRARQVTGAIDSASCGKKRVVVHSGHAVSRSAIPSSRRELLCAVVCDSSPVLNTPPSRRTVDSPETTVCYSAIGSLQT